MNKKIQKNPSKKQENIKKEAEALRKNLLKRKEQEKAKKDTKDKNI